jgi:hypothetical protein
MTASRRVRISADVVTVTEAQIDVARAAGVDSAEVDTGLA